MPYVGSVDAVIIAPEMTCTVRITVSALLFHAMPQVRKVHLITQAYNSCLTTWINLSHARSVTGSMRVNCVDLRRAFPVQVAAVDAAVHPHARASVLFYLRQLIQLRAHEAPREKMKLADTYVLWDAGSILVKPTFLFLSDGRPRLAVDERAVGASCPSTQALLGRDSSCVAPTLVPSHMLIVRKHLARSLLSRLCVQRAVDRCMQRLLESAASMALDMSWLMARELYISWVHGDAQTVAQAASAQNASGHIASLELPYDWSYVSDNTSFGVRQVPPTNKSWGAEQCSGETTAKPVVLLGRAGAHTSSLGWQRECICEHRMVQHLRWRGGPRVEVVSLDSSPWLSTSPPPPPPPPPPAARLPRPVPRPPLPPPPQSRPPAPSTLNPTHSLKQHIPKHKPKHTKLTQAHPSRLPSPPRPTSTTPSPPSLGHEPHRLKIRTDQSPPSHALAQPYALAVVPIGMLSGGVAAVILLGIVLLRQLHRLESHSHRRNLEVAHCKQ